MYKSVTTEIKKHSLTPDLHRLHKVAELKSDFGMDNSPELIDGGFGLYSTANLKGSIGPVKTEYYRIGLIRSGSATYTLGLETFQPVRNTIVFGFPGQLFSLQEPTADFFAYYMLFSDNFISESLLLKGNKNRFPFLSYSGVQCFELSEEAGSDIEALILKINEEVKNKKAHLSQAIQLYIQLILIESGRIYAQKILAKPSANDSGASLFTRFLKLVSEHFLKIQKVSDYAGMLHVSADHLNRTIKSHSDKTAHELIDQMILNEAKACLLHSELTVSEIAYQLGFSDPSHFNKFFKKLSSCTPLQFRGKRT